MKKQIAIAWKGGKSTVPAGTPLWKVRPDRPAPGLEPALAEIGGKIVDLLTAPSKSVRVNWIPKASMEGMRAYRQTLCLILISAVHVCAPGRRFLINHSLGNGLYCEIPGIRMDGTLIRRIRETMKSIVRQNHTLKSIWLDNRRTRAFLESQGESAYTLAGEKNKGWIFYSLGNVQTHLEGPLLPSTGCIDAFGLIPWPPGLILQFPPAIAPDRMPLFVKQPRLFKVFQEFGVWESIIGTDKTAHLNEAVVNGTIGELVAVSEGLHEKKIAAIADRIARRKRPLVLVAGPSSSGKTTFTKRLLIQLRVLGLRLLVLSMDDYFLERDRLARLSKGKVDLESPASLDIKALDRDLERLMAGEEVQLRRYNFKAGRSVPGPRVRLESGQPIVLEGIHGLNDAVTPGVSAGDKLKIYTSALTQINITDHVRVPTSDVRLLRRMIRDNQFRGYPPSRTLDRWQDVRFGEDRFIFPFQETADIIFNSALTYELPVLRTYAEPLLSRITRLHPQHNEAQRLLHLLHGVIPIPGALVPPNSILREFIGGSSFEY